MAQKCTIKSFTIESRACHADGRLKKCFQFFLFKKVCKKFSCDEMFEEESFLGPVVYFYLYRKHQQPKYCGYPVYNVNCKDFVTQHF